MRQRRLRGRPKHATRSRLWWARLLILAAPLWLPVGATVQAASAPATFYQAVSVSSTPTTVTIGFDATVLLLINDGPQTAYIRFGGTATTADFPLPSGQRLELGLLTRVGTVSLVCAPSETATVKLWAIQ